MNTDSSARSLRRTAALPLLALVALALTPVVSAQSAHTGTSTSPQSLVNSDPNYESVRQSLLDQPSGEITFDRASLSTVLRMLATKSGIRWLSAQQNKDWDKQLVTLSMNASPFAVLETIADEYGIALVYDRGVWHLRPFNDSELIARTYVIKYNTAEKAEGDIGSGGGDEMGGGSGGISGGGFGGGGGGGFGGGGGGGGGFGMDLGSINTNFNVEAKALVENVEKLLGIGTSGLDFNVARTTNVDEFSNSPMRLTSRPPTNSEDKKEAVEAKVVWNSDGNTLFVVATRQQHQMVSAYIATLDTPQPLIAVEFKFVETTKDPKNQMGIDWSGTLDGGFPLKLSGLETSLDLNRIGSTVLPNSAVLTPGDMNVKLNFLMKDRDTSTASYPRVLTLNNRAVTMRSVVNFPVLASSASTSAGGGGTSTNSVAFMPIGTTVNILPKRMETGEVLMQTKIVVANVIGQEIIGGNPYPVPSSRVYTSPLKVKSGYTVAIAGLDEATDSRSGAGVPVLSRLPVLGWAFKNRYKDRARKNLMIFITPTIIEPNGRGVAEKPLSEVPRYYDDQPHGAPAFLPSGHLSGGPGKLPKALLWSDREERRLRIVCEEGRGTKAVLEEIDGLIANVSRLQAYAGAVAIQANTDTLALQRYNLDMIARRSVILRKSYFKKEPKSLGL